MNIRQLIAEEDPRDVLGVSPTTTLQDVARKLAANRIGALVVVDQTDALVGIVSERDLIGVVANYSKEAVLKPVTTVMTKDVITCSPSDEVAYILRLMNTKAIRHMPVIEDDVLVSMLSIRQLATAYELLRIEANTDPLTEVSNRRQFLQTLADEFDQARATGKPLTVAMLDVDHFKRVNDTYGHEAGDRVLREMSAMLIREFRTIDLVGRLGGEEFGLVFRETGLEGSKTACERLLANIRRAQISVRNQLRTGHFTLDVVEPGEHVLLAFFIDNDVRLRGCKANATHHCVLGTH